MGVLAGVSWPGLKILWETQSLKFDLPYSTGLHVLVVITDDIVCWGLTHQVC